MSAPFSLRIFVADGDPDGLRIVERGNWNGRALVFPRSSYPRVKQRGEVDCPGVYLLMGPTPDGAGESLYIGEGDPVKPRLDHHYAHKDFWTKCVFFTAKEFLNKTCIQYLEARLVSLAKSAKRVPLENANSPALPSIGEADQADMESFLSHILVLLPLLGIHAFIRPDLTNPEGDSSVVGPVLTDRISLTCIGKGITAKGFDGSEGFVVLAGSGFSLEETPSLRAHLPSVERLRHELVSNGVVSIKEDSAQRIACFNQNYVFSSPSLAAAVVLGRSANGRVEWKDDSGRALKVIQEDMARV